MDTCGKCRFWNFKTSGDRAWGRCLNPKVQENILISFSKVQELFELPREVIKATKEYAEVYFEEDNFGCIHFDREIDPIEETQIAIDLGILNWDGTASEDIL